MHCSQGHHQSGPRLTAQLVLPPLPIPKHTPTPLLCPGWAAHLTVTQAACARTSNHPHFHPSCPCLSPSCSPRTAATGQILPALSLALHKPSLAPPHQCCSCCSQAGSFLNQDSSFWQQLPASDPDFIPGCLTARL